MTRRSVISLFSGAMGLDLGLEKAGFAIRVAVECNNFAAETIRTNRPDIALIEEKLGGVSTDAILEDAGLSVGDVTVVTGGPSCQTFSTAGQRGSLGDPRGSMFRQFLRVVREARPQFFVLENVTGVLSAAVRHRPLLERGPGYPPLLPDEELGSAFRVILRELKKLNYRTVVGVLCAADFGVPQVRRRVIFIGSRDHRPVLMPTPTHAEMPTNGTSPWVTIKSALEGLTEADPTYYEFPPSKKKFLRHVPAGGNWRDLPPRLQREALGKAYDSWGGRAGFFRRLGWDRPAPALTTRPDSKATMFCHPTELRPLSVREFARLQCFPDDWVFSGPLRQQYVQVGNAVPVLLGYAIGQSIRAAMRSRRTVDPVDGIVCHDASLVERLAKRPKTVLNPSRMRKRKSSDAAREWIGGRNHREKVLRYLVLEASGDDVADV